MLKVFHSLNELYLIYLDLSYSTQIYLKLLEFIQMFLIEPKVQWSCCIINYPNLIESIWWMKLFEVAQIWMKL